jgi:putative endonuclease
MLLAACERPPLVIPGLSRNPKEAKAVMKRGFVYIMASRRNGTLYVGVTSDLIKRVYEHKSDIMDGFTKKYGVHALVYFEDCGDIETAIAREKQIKGWRRAYKTNVINKHNPQWDDLYPQILGMDSGTGPE